ncbi:hypothetical protein [Dyella sp.]|jgi:hypothetical protein|uniref:hypothetical protein n=1 Tax=Dyella sp. TaxID=1869338 RepID=UPI002D77E2EE|nr:hypothetical protein [Dyella sp.]HET6432638.1 hypothetical protein [Dyella sp.]
MTSRNVRGGALLAALVAASLSPLAAARQYHPPPPPRPVLIQPTASQVRFRQAVQQSQVRDQLQKNQVEHALHQQSLEMTRRKADSANPNDQQVDQAKQAQDRLYQARQRDRLQRYSDALTPQPVPAQSTASKPKDAGH